ncbi:DUF5916 domain-containing protein [Neptunitalea lumnitzerae]|uniref:DUF5916 domain-containing protein n=1 Tax=Neptunitalea lumnitzerae TaxID=2965509 RepID=A0ABQ5MN72_9FLAO|nr:DUF5916 domain-containing protein [Neptunitalea sp. Y10]GLB50782.1 hypothetical protein Y10_31500 [Neptunitalea sp. Y10]
MKQLYVTLFLCLGILVGKAQEKDTIPRKHITITRVTVPPVIDGKLDDAAWIDAPIATNFIERQPVNGLIVPDSLKTEVKIVYDNLGIYFGAFMRDPEPEKIQRELTERDNIGNDDFFFVLLNGYNDRQQSLEFVVTAAGVQWDSRMTNDSEDDSWNAVWYSDVSIQKDGWVAEMFIPYSQLRFPKKDVQTWGLNMEREFRRDRRRFSWSHIDNTKGSFSIYDGVLHGIENIDTPTRLSFQPYISTYVADYDGQSEVTVNGGLDVKYGINDAFTLDMILIPDFGQTKFDNKVLNLSAFEVQYDEQRPFFTEGTELFSKGELVYSRRIGGSPSGSVNLGDNEQLVDYPSKVDLINAMKISGRTDKGLGLGFFNAVTKKTKATVENTITGERREEVVEPLANYNVLVLDQRFGDNSSVSFVNTNVTRDGGFRDANATGAYMNLTNKKNTYNYYAQAEGSWVWDDDTKIGLESTAGFSKISGAHRVQGQVSLRTKDYDINDLGYSSITNYINYYGYYGYRYLQPKGNLNNMYLNFNLHLNRRLQPDLYSEFIFNFNSSFTTKKFLAYGGGFETTPIGVNDIYEPRIDGKHLDEPAYYNPWVWISTDYRKKFAMDLTFDWYAYDAKNRNNINVYFSPRYRFSDKWKMFYNMNFYFDTNDRGFVNYTNPNIIIGERNRNTVETSLESQYIFNPTMSVNLAFRHYYSEVSYDRYFTLQNNGSVLEDAGYAENHDGTYNSWNIDLSYSWWFAPGSQLTFLYRNSIESYEALSGRPLNDNFDALFAQPQSNTFSIRISYFLDYNRVKNWFGKNDNQAFYSQHRNAHTGKIMHF